MKCPKCEAKMKVIRTEHWGSMTVRDLRCPQCDQRERSFETFGEHKDRKNATCSA